MKPGTPALTFLSVYVFSASPVAGADPCQARPGDAWARGVEGQRRADLGDGGYLAAVVRGGRPGLLLISLHYSADGRDWTRYDTRMDVSGYHHNTVNDFLSNRRLLLEASVRPSIEGA